MSARQAAARSARRGARTRIARRALAALLAAAAGAGFATRAAASLFSTDGLGETMSAASARGRALGGATTALADSIRVSLDNPALLASLRRVSVSTIYVTDRRAAESDSASATFRDSAFPFLHGALPLGGVVLGFGLTREQSLFVSPLTRVRAESPAPHSVRFERDGDIFRVPASIAVRLAPQLAVGGSFDFWFGKIDETRIVDFDAADFRDASDRVSDDIDGIGASAGLVATPHPRVTLGARYRAKETLSGDRTRSTADGAGGRTRVRHTMPASFALGATVAATRGLLATIDLRRDLWEGEEVDAPVTGRFVDVTRIGGGVEIASRGRDASWLRRRPWRVGYSAADWHFVDADGDRIREWLLGGGTSFGLGGRTGVIDLFVEWGKRGDLAENDLEEKITRVGIGFAGGEEWKRPERRGRRGSVKPPPETY